MDEEGQEAEPTEPAASLMLPRGLQCMGSAKPEKLVHVAIINSKITIHNRNYFPWGESTLQ